MHYTAWPKYVPVAERKRRAVQHLARMKKNGRHVEPVVVAGRTITESFWGNSWCENLERYSDYENRLPRGRSYVRNGSVVDLEIAKGKIAAFVAGSQLYKVTIAIEPLAQRHWKSVCRDCGGTINSLVELLGGRLARRVMDRVCRKGDGLFPSPGEIRLSCSCPDWADMCKHVAAALYAVGARLDAQPELLFVLRGVDQNELLSTADDNVLLSKKVPCPAKVLKESDIASVFGFEMAASGETPPLNGKAPAPPKPRRRKRAAKKSRPAARKSVVPAKKSTRARRAAPNT